MNRKWSHSVKPQRRYGAELTALSIARQFLENGSATEVRILVVERAGDF